MQKSLFALALTTLIAGTSNAQAPDSIGFQGYLTDSFGDPMDSSNVVLTFRLYKGASNIWTETQVVDVDSGLLNVLLGEVTPLDTVAFNQAIDLGITIDGDPPEIVPRTPLASSPFALGMRGMYSVWADDGLREAMNVVGGSSINAVSDDAVGVTISGGGGWDEGNPRPNSVLADWASIGGGARNEVSGPHGTIGGGWGNRAGHSSTVGGGTNNWATGRDATIAGGWYNRATGEHACVPGGRSNSARGTGAFAAGYQAKAAHEGTFVWSDRSSLPAADSLFSTGPNQFLIRATGGVGIGLNAPSTALHVYGAGSDVGGVPPFPEIIARIQGPANTALSIDAPTGYDPLLYFANNGSGIWSFRNNAPSNVFQLRRPGASLSTIVLEIKREAAESYVRPGVDSLLDLGTSDRRWKAVYAADGLITTSDERLKGNMTVLNYGLEEILRLKPVQYRWKNRPAGRRLGFSAQQVESVLPEVVARPESNDGHYGMNYAELIPVLVKAIQEQQAQIERMREMMAQAGIE